MSQTDNSHPKHRKIFGLKVKRLREIHNLNQEDLAAALEYSSKNFVSDVERGVKGMRTEKIYELAKFFNVPPIVLLTDEDMSEQDLRIAQKALRLTGHPENPYIASIEALMDKAIAEIDKNGGKNK